MIQLGDLIKALAELGLYPLPLRSHPGHKAGRYLPIIGQVRHIAGSAPVASTITAIPFMVQDVMTWDRLGARVTTFAASGNFQLAIYAADPTTDAPTGAPLAYTGDISTAVADFVSGALNASLRLYPGRLYWLAYNCNASAGGTCVMQVPDTSTPVFGYFVGSATGTDVNAGATVLSCYLRSLTTGLHTYGTWPDLTAVTLTPISTDTRYATAFYRTASVP